MKRKIRVTESELINSIEKIIKEQSAVLGFGNTNGFNNMGIGRPTEKYRELGETHGGGNYSINLYNDPSATQDGMGIFEDDDELNEFYDDRTLEDKIKDWKNPLDGWDNPVWWNTQQGGGKGKRAMDSELSEGGCGGYEMYEGGCGDQEMYEGGCGDVQYESNLSRIVRNELVEAQAKEAKKWIQGAVKRPGALRKKLGVRKGKDISLDMIDKKMKQIKTKDSNKKKKGVQGLTKADLRTYKQLNLAKSLRKMAKKKHASEAKRFKK